MKPTEAYRMSLSPNMLVDDDQKDPSLDAAPKYPGEIDELDQDPLDALDNAGDRTESSEAIGDVPRYPGEIDELDEDPLDAIDNTRDKTESSEEIGDVHTDLPTVAVFSGLPKRFSAKSLNSVGSLGSFTSTGSSVGWLDGGLSSDSLDVGYSHEAGFRSNEMTNAQKANFTWNTSGNNLQGTGAAATGRRVGRKKGSSANLAGGNSMTSNGSSVGWLNGGMLSSDSLDVGYSQNAEFRTNEMSSAQNAEFKIGEQKAPVRKSNLEGKKADILNFIHKAGSQGKVDMDSLSKDFRGLLNSGHHSSAGKDNPFFKTLS